MYADSMNIPDMIVVGSRGRAGLTGLLLGSMSQSLIQDSNILVYVVPRKYVDYTAHGRLNALATCGRMPAESISKWMEPFRISMSIRLKPVSSNLSLIILMLMLNDRY